MTTFIWPTDTKRITSEFRTPLRPNHHGLDIADPGPRPIYAVADGVVVKSYLSTSYGECIIIRHNIDGQEWESLYAHMRSGSRGYVEGQRVNQGDQIGIMGNTGNSSGQHLHFELHKGRWNINKTDAVDPLEHLEIEEFKPDMSKGIGYLEVKADALNVREKSSFTSDIIKVIHHGDKYYVYDEVNGLYAIGKDQWVSANSKYVTFHPHPKEEEKKEDPDYIGHRYEEEIKKIKDYGLMQGYPNGDFKPEDTLSRGQFAVVLSRMIDKGYIKK